MVIGSKVRISIKTHTWTGIKGIATANGATFSLEIKIHGNPVQIKLHEKIECDVRVLGEENPFTKKTVEKLNALQMYTPPANYSANSFFNPMNSIFGRHPIAPTDRRAYFVRMKDLFKSGELMCTRGYQRIKRTSSSFEGHQPREHDQDHREDAGYSVV